MKLDKKIEKALLAIEVEYEGRRQAAGMGGRHDDGGYREKMQQLEYFKDGIRFERAGIVPDWLADAVHEVEIKEDPEYAEYQRLKEKFEK